MERLQVAYIHTQSINTRLAKQCFYTLSSRHTDNQRHCMCDIMYSDSKLVVFYPLKIVDLDHFDSTDSLNSHMTEDVMLYFYTVWAKHCPGIVERLQVAYMHNA